MVFNRFQGSSDERFSHKPSSSLSGDIEGRGNAGHYIKESLSSFQTRESNDLLYKNHLKSLTPVKSNTGSALNVTGDEDKNGIASDADDDDLVQQTVLANLKKCNNKCSILDHKANG